MDTLLGTLRQTRHDLVERGTKIAEATRERGIDALGKVRSGALDWRRTVAARRAALEEEQRGWFRFAGLQLRVLNGVDRALGRFAREVRSEIKRLQRLELPQSSTAPVEPAPLAAAPASAEPASAEPAKKAPRKTARKKSNGHSAPKRLVLPIADYEALNVKQIVAELPRLTDAQCRVLLEHERAHKKRKTLLDAISARLAQS